MADTEAGGPPVGSSAPSAGGGHHHGASSRPARGRSDQHHNPLKTPLLEKVRSRSRPITEEESKVKHTWVYAKTFMAVMGNISLGFGLGFTSPTQVEMTADLNLTTSQFSTFGSVIMWGCMVGAIISGRSADYFGRRGGLIVCCIPSIWGFLLVTFGQNTIPLYIGRFAIGLAGGVVCYIVPVLVAEAAPRHLRGFLSTMLQFSLSVGIMLVYFFGLFLPWRVLAAVGTVPSVISLIGFMFVPESPYWLAKMERTEELKLSLQKLRGQDYSVDHELADIQASAESEKLQPKAKLSDLLQKKYARPLFAGCGVHMLQQITGINGVMLYSGAIFLAAGVESANTAALSIAVLQVIMTFVAAGLADKAGRRLLLLVSTSGMTLGLFFVGLSFYIRANQRGEHGTAGMEIFVNILALSSLLVYAASFSLGIGPVPWVLVGEIFPNQVKSMAGSMASLVNWTCAWAVTMTFNFFLEWSTSGTFWLFGAISFFAIIFVSIFVPETRGKTLEQIQQSFK